MRTTRIRRTRRIRSLSKIKRIVGIRDLGGEDEKGCRGKVEDRRAFR